MTRSILAGLLVGGVGLLAIGCGSEAARRADDVATGGTEGMGTSEDTRTIVVPEGVAR